MPRPSATRNSALKKFQLIAGIVAWLVMVVAAAIGIRNWHSGTDNATGQLTAFLTQGRTRVAVEFEMESWVGVGDPVIVNDGTGSRIVGNVVQISVDPNFAASSAWTDNAVVELYSTTPRLVDGDYLSYHETPDSMEWMVQMMLPPKTREEIGQLIVDAWQAHQSEIAEALQPILVKSFQEAADVIREEFYHSISGRESQIQSLANRYQIELVEQELIPMVQDEIWPIVQQETTPLALEIGEEIWQQASLWRFGWRFVYDRSPLPERNLVKQEFERFLQKYGIPVIEARLADILAVQRNILQRVAENDKVRTVASQATHQVLRDPEFQQLATDVLRDVVIDNPRLTKAFEDNWSSSEARDALALTNLRLESTVTKIGQTLFGAPNTSITPEFSRVLRNRILFKDDRWLELHLKPVRAGNAAPSSLTVAPGTTGIENPFFVPPRSDR